jgi:hypothetical protein
MRFNQKRLPESMNVTLQHVAFHLGLMVLATSIQVRLSTWLSQSPASPNWFKGAAGRAGFLHQTHFYLLHFMRYSEAFT